MPKQTMACNYEGDALLLFKIAKIVRKDIASYKGFSFDGKFSSGCQQQSVPSTLKTLVSMLLYGADLRDQDYTDSQANLTILQTILFNFKKHASFAKSRHSPIENHRCHCTLEQRFTQRSRSRTIITTAL
jgi:hypothetical protein